MLLNIPHPELGPQSSALSADVLAAAISSSVKNNEGFAQNDYVLFGALAEEQTEIVLLTSISGVDTLGHTTGPVFPHEVNTKINQIPYNKIEIYRSTTETGTYTLLATIDINVDESETIYDDTSGTATSWYKVRFISVATSVTSDYSDPMLGTGYEEDSLYSMAMEVADEYGDSELQELTLGRIYKQLRAGVRAIVKKIITFYPEYRRAYITQALSANVAAYSLPERFLGFVRVDVNYSGTNPADATKVETFDSEGDQGPEEGSQSDPRISIRGEDFIVKPTPTGSGMAFLWYWDSPTEMTSESDTHGLPYGARDLLISYALYKLWIPKDKETADQYKNDFRDAGNDFADFVGQSRQAISNKFVKVTFGSDMYERD